MNPNQHFFESPHHDFSENPHPDFVFKGPHHDFESPHHDSESSHHDFEGPPKEVPRKGKMGGEHFSDGLGRGQKKFNKKYDKDEEPMFPENEKEEQYYSCEENADPSSPHLHDIHINCETIDL